MATKKSSGLKVPVRPAPAPPPGRPSVLSVSKQTPNLMDSWDLSFEDPPRHVFSMQGSNRSVAWPDMHNTKKKVPPPRPPPPRITASTAGKSGFKNLPKLSSKQPSRPSELLSNLFLRRGTKGEPAPPHAPGGLSNRSAMPALAPVSSAVATASLIDLSSPPSSPTPTTRSSSDGLSVDSFGSDGTASHSHHHSQVESGFEDDSELFGGFTATPSPVNRDPWASSPSTPSDVFSPVNSVPTSSKNPWSTTPQDPFSPPRKFTSSPTPAPAPTLSVPSSVPVPGVVAFKPTIIRPKVKANSSPSVSRAKFASSPMPGENESGDDRSESPPMPSIPPPAPPPEVLSELGNSLSSGIETLSMKGKNVQGPHCIALYDYEASHSDDLHFKEGDVIELVKELSEDWLQGRIGGREGMFPANFVNILVPLSNAGGILATALYTFTPETWEDLGLQEGAKVRLLSRVNNDWLYGECNGKRGQFPVTFVDNVPSNLPIHS